jgi:hypothetical protein
MFPETSRRGCRFISQERWQDVARLAHFDIELDALRRKAHAGFSRRDFVPLGGSDFREEIVTVRICGGGSFHAQ